LEAMGKAQNFRNSSVEFLFALDKTAQK
jgi:hypothetical protein